MNKKDSNSNSSLPSAQELEMLKSLRPPSFNDFAGQNKLKERLQLMITAALQRGDALGHVLLSGPPGLGKTSLAHIIATAMGNNIHITSGPQIEKAGDLVGVLTNLEQGDVLFIDEIHRLHPAVEEYLYPAMEDYKLDIVIDKGPNARTIQLSLPRFTLIGATTRSGMITAPMRSRFMMKGRLEYYEDQDLAEIIERSAKILNLTIDKEGSMEIASRSRGTPRIANSLLHWVRDFAQVKSDGSINKETSIKALKMMEIDDDGLDELDILFLETLIIKFEGGPVGINNLAVAIAEDIGTIEEVYEPYLIMKGFIKRTPRGRVALPSAYTKLGMKNPFLKFKKSNLYQSELF